MVSFLFLQSRSVQCYDVVCCQNRRGKKAPFPTFPLWQTRVGGPWWERACLCTTGNFIGKLWTGTHYSLIIVTIITENYRLLSTLDTSLVSDETGSSALERETHLGCQPQLQTVRSKFRDSLEQEHPDLGATISEPLLLRRRYKI